MDSTKLTDAGLAPLKALKNLRELNLSWTHVTDAGLKQLEEDLPQLQSLYLRGLYLSDAGLVHLRGLKNLRTLYLSGQPVTDAGLVHIMELKQLMGLGLSSTRVTDAGFANLPTLKNLRNLNLERTRVTDAIFAQLKGLAQLEDLSLGGTRVTEAGLAALQGLKNLRFLSLKGTSQLSDSVVPQLVKVRSLTEIDLSDTRLSAKGYASLKTGLPGLVRTRLDRRKCRRRRKPYLRPAAPSRFVCKDRTVPSRRSRNFPSEPFQITGVSLAGVHSPLEAALTALADPRVDGLVSLNLSGAVVKGDDWLRLKKLRSPAPTGAGGQLAPGFRPGSARRTHKSRRAVAASRRDHRLRTVPSPRPDEIDELWQSTGRGSPMLALRTSRA